MANNGREADGGAQSWSGHRWRLPVVVLVSIAVLLAALKLGTQSYFTVDSIRAATDHVRTYYHAHDLLFTAGFVSIYTLINALYLPGALALMLVGGALFGPGLGTLWVSLGATLGATAGFLLSRHFLYHRVQRAYPERLRGVNQGIERDGAFYLFILRLLPGLPNTVTTLLMGVTPIRVRTFFWVTLVGLLPWTAVYVFAGDRLAQLRSLSDIFSPGLIGAFLAVIALSVAGRLIARARSDKRADGGSI